MVYKMHRRGRCILYTTTKVQGPKLLVNTAAVPSRIGQANRGIPPGIVASSYAGQVGPRNLKQNTPEAFLKESSDTRIASLFRRGVQRCCLQTALRGNLPLQERFPAANWQTVGLAAVTVFVGEVVQNIFRTRDCDCQKDGIDHTFFQKTVFLGVVYKYPRRICPRH